MRKPIENNSCLWTPSQEWAQNSTISHFISFINKNYSKSKQISSYEELYQWSISHFEIFWLSIWNYFPVIRHREPQTICQTHKEMWKSCWFQGARLNFAENLLCANAFATAYEDQNAIVFVSELGYETTITYKDLFKEVIKLSMGLEKLGVSAGDRVAGYMPNIPETVIAMLATASLGAVWSSCSCDFGAEGVLDRFLQIEPKVIFTTDGYSYKGKAIPTASRLSPLILKLNEKKINPTTVIVPYLENLTLSKNAQLYELPNSIAYAECLQTGSRLSASQKFSFASREFNDPLYIMFSSGTTGKPKCIVHGIGGTLLQHIKELCLHSNLKTGDSIFFYTTCGWMMWNWLASALFCKATVVLYEGNPFYPHPHALVKMIEKHGITHFGAGAKYFQTLQQTSNAHKELSIKPLYQQYNFNSLKVVLSTGSPLSTESFRYIYKEIKQDLQLSSISGGTDIISCFVLGAPMLPVYEGEIQCRGLGMAVEVHDENQNPVVNTKGDLVCVKPFPSMPLYFYRDKNDELYRNAYFKNANGIWKHGDFAEIKPHCSEEGKVVSQSIIIYGRSDTTLNPGGVRIGTAEIYRVIESFVAIEESVVAGRQIANDIEIVLGAKLAEKHASVDLQELSNLIREKIKKSCTARHVPRYIFFVDDIPKTINGKISEMSVSNVINNRINTNEQALANPESLHCFRNLLFDKN